MVSQETKARPRTERCRAHAEGESSILATLAAEIIGTFFLTFVSAAPIAIQEITGKLQNVDLTAPAGMVVAALIYTLGPISGAHFNPAVTLGFALRRAFPWKMVPAYWGAQLFGATMAGGIVALMFGAAAHDGANVPHVGIWQSLAMEIVFTYLLVLVILSTSNQHKIAGPNAALAVGLTIALCGLVGGPVSGASMNPARSLGPAWFGGDDLGSVWIYLLGPAIGSALAALSVHGLHGHCDREEHKQATGDHSRIN